MMTSRTAWYPLCLAVVLLAVGASCSNGTDSGPQDEGSGGDGSGGTSAQGQGGQGAVLGSGGRAAAGGSTPSGGTLGSGGSPGSGGRVGTGGSGGGSPDAGTSHPGSGGSAAGSDAGTAVSYAKDIEPLLKSNCTSCHGGSSPTAGIDLSSYAKVKANASAASSVIQRGSMPPNGPLSTANKQLFAAWVSAGAPNN